VIVKKIFEAWVEEEPDVHAILLAMLETVAEHRTKGLLAATAKFLHRIEVDTYEEVKAVHHIKMGWEPYIPEGDAEPCPRGCGSCFYPRGSGECPNCGPIC
jgi:hypothetical protein